MGRRRIRAWGAAAAAVLAAGLLGAPAPALGQAAPPSITLSPTSGIQGTTFDVTGSGFAPGVTVVIRWDGLAPPIGSAVTGRSGGFVTSVSALAPSSVGGHVVVAECSGCPAPQVARATFTVLNSPPTANPDKMTVQSGGTQTIDVVANDTDVDGNIVGVTGTTSAAHGQVDFSGRNVTYVSSAGYSGPDSFRYTICDAGQECSSATVDVTVTPLSTTTSTSTTTTSTTTTTTQPPTTTTTTTQPPTTTTTSTTTTTTQPPTTTTTSTTTTTTSTTTTTTTPTTTTTTRADNERPVVVEDATDTEPGARVTINPLANDRDPDGELDAATLTIIREPQHGAASVADGLISYRPEPGFAGEDSLVYRVCDDGGLCNAARVVLTVAGPAAPVTTTTTVPEQECEIDPADVVSFTADPPRGPAGIDVFLDLEVSADVVSECLLPEVQFTFDGGALGPPVPLQPNPGASATVTVPAAAPVGFHTVGATQLGAAPVELGTTEFEVIAVPSEGGGIPGWLPPTAGAAAAVVAAAVIFRRRPDYRHVPVTGGGECSSIRQRLLDARQDAARAAASADDAAVAAAGARTAADEARAELLRCREGGGVAAREGRDMPMMGATPASQDAGEVGEGFHLLDFENPNAPLQDDGHFGWYFPGRAAAISGVVLHVTRVVGGAAVEGPAMSVADTYSKAQVPRSVHAVVDDTGAVPLLPDDYTALHTPGSDEASLAMEVVWEPGMGEDAEALENAAAWFAAKIKQHGIPARHVTREEWLDGTEGIIGHEALLAGGDDLGFPWERFLDLVDAAEKLPQPVALRIHRRARTAADPCAAVSERAHTAESGAMSAEQEAGSLQAAALSAQSQVEAQREAVWDCECRTPTEEVPPTPEEDEPEHRRERFYLLEHENALAKMRANGKRGHYSTVRKGLIRGIVVHTAEGDDAAGVADYFATVKRAVSGHVVVDPQGWVKLLPDRYAAFHAKRANDDSLGLLFACHAADWGTDPVGDAAMLRLGAVWAGIKARLYGIPLKRLTKAEWKAGERGFVAHSDIDGRGFSDPGDGFDWDAFLAMAGGKLLTPR